jgi:methionyl-tRNA formyltransferase
VKLAFLGTPEVAAGTLRALVAAGHDVAVVVTRADNRRGRGPASGPSPVKAVALGLGLPVVHRPAELVSYKPELGIVVAYGRLIKPDVLAEVPMVNIHFSLLPRWRGAAPVERAIMAGDTETGVCLMQLEEGLDTGPIFARSAISIGDDETADELRHQLGEIGTRLLLHALADGLGRSVPQTGEPTYAAKVEPAELHLDFSLPADVVNRTVRLGRAWTTFRGKRLLVRRARVLRDDTALSAGQIQDNTVGTGEGALELQLVQPEGKPVMDAAAWARGAHPGPDERMGE